MAALNIAHELLTTRVPGGVDVGEVKRRMHSMQSAIDAALSSQDKLF
jgi:cell division protein ZapA